MKFSRTSWGALALAISALAGCGGGGGGGGGGTPLPSTSIGQAIAAAAAVAANDTSTNSSSAFKVLQDAGVPAMTVPATGPATVNFTVFSGGTVKTGLTNANIRIAIAKLVPGTNGNIDQWMNYVSRTETATQGVGPNGNPVLASARQATTDPNTAASVVYNADGYYTYTLTTDIRDPAKTAGVTFEPNRTHRVAIQLSYTDMAGQTVLVNPYFDITFDASGKSVAVSDPSKTRVMADVSSCNGCHERLALHGGGRVDVQFCVMCHNSGTTDANSGNVLTMQTMVHKIHAGRRLATTTGGEDYVIWGYRDSRNGYAEVGFPQDLRNCSVCHSAANPKTPQGDNWKRRASKESCLTCHANNAGSNWDTTHAIIANALVAPGAAAKQIANADCAACHREGSNLGADRVHWNQNEENAAKYKMNIESATYDSAARKVTVKYHVSDPTNNNAAYNLLTPDCTGSGATLTCSNTTKFGNLRFYLAYQNLVGQSTLITEFTAYNNGGSSANAYAYKGTNDGSNHYTVDIPLPADSATAVAAGTARVVSIGQVKEPLLEVRSTDPRPAVVPTVLINTVMQHTYMEVALTGTLNPRRQVVSNEKCNVCHGSLGTASGSNTANVIANQSNAFHSGARNSVEACPVCHDANRMSSTVMTNGLALNESYQFKRMIHGIHGNSRRTYPFTHGNPVAGVFSKEGSLQADGFFLSDQTVTVNNLAKTVITAGTVVPKGATFQTIESMLNTARTNAGYTGSPASIENYAAEVLWPGVGVNCNACHVNDSHKTDRGPLGAVVSKPLVGSPLAADTNPLNWMVISPMAATCTACHDSAAAMDHVKSFGNGSFGNRTQANSMKIQEVCADCHAIGGFKGVDIVHGLK